MGRYYLPVDTTLCWRRFTWQFLLFWYWSLWCNYSNWNNKEMEKIVELPISGCFFWQNAVIMQLFRASTNVPAPQLSLLSLFLYVCIILSDILGTWVYKCKQKHFWNAFTNQQDTIYPKNHLHCGFFFLPYVLLSDFQSLEHVNGWRKSSDGTVGSNHQRSIQQRRWMMLTLMCPAKWIQGDVQRCQNTNHKQFTWDRN